MRILTVRQPWAWAIIRPGKDIENRSTNIAGSYRGPIAIHAGSKFDKESWNLYRETAPISAADIADPLKDAVYGQIIGVVDLLDVHRSWLGETANASYCHSSCSSWAFATSAYHLVLANPRQVQPVPYIGFLGLRKIEDPALLDHLQNS
jgi:hypothetical protein